MSITAHKKYTPNCKISQVASLIYNYKFICEFFTISVYF